MANPYEKFKADYSAPPSPLQENANIDSLKTQEVINQEKDAPQENPYAAFKQSGDVAPASKANPYAEFKTDDVEPEKTFEDEVELKVTDPQVVYNPILEDKEDLTPADVSTNEAISNKVVKRDILGGLKDKFNKESFTNFMLQPVGQHIIENALKINSESLLEHVGVPENFPIDPNMKYPPHIKKLIEVTGGDFTKMKDRLAVSIFLDTLAAKGFSRLKLAVDTRGNEMTAAVSRLAQMSDDTLDAANRLLIKSEGVGEDVLGNTEKVADAIFDAAPKKQSLDPLLNTKSMLMSSDDQIIGGAVVMNNASNAGANVIKVAPTRIDKFNKLMANSDMLNNPERIIKEGEVLKDVLPAPGKADVTYFNKGGWAIMRSPQNYAPNVYEQISLLEQRQAQIKSGFRELLDPILKLEGSEQARFVGAIADNQPVAKEIIAKGLLNEEGIAALNLWKKISKEAAKLRKLPEEKQVSSYLTRIWEEAKTSTIPASEDLKLLVNAKSRFEKARVGGTGYTLDVAKAARVYVNDTAKVVAKREFHKDILGAVDDIKAIDPVRGNIADIYQLNYFGETGKASPKALQSMSHAVKAAFARGTIAWNLGTGLLNLTQAPIFGAAKIGYKAYARGVKMFGKMVGPGGEKYKKLLRESGIFEGGTVEELQQAGSFWEKAISKVPGGKFVVKHQFKFMDYSEKLNKGTIYLGAYDDAVRKLSFVASKTTRKAKRTADFLKRSGVNPTGDIAEEAHKYARKAVADTQIDMGRAGQNSIANNPFGSVVWMYMSFPFKMAEYSLKTATTASKHLGRAVAKGSPSIALNSPEVRSAMRLGLNFLVVKQVGELAGVSLRRITGADNLIPSLAPLVQVGVRGWQAVEALAQKDGTAAEKITKTILTMTGLPINSPLWKIKSILKAAADNEGATGDWTIYNKRNGKAMYKASPMQYMFGEALGFIEPKTEEEYHELMKDQSNRYKTIRNLSNRISKATQQLKNDRDNEALKNKRKADQALIRKLKREIKIGNRTQKKSLRKED